MDYSKMSDFEINKRVANKLKRYTPLNYPHDADKRSVGALCSDDTYCWYDYCNKPADAWPIIQSNGISLVKYEHGMWLASCDAHWVDGVEWQIDGEAHPNPLRAAMIAFLMMQEEKMNAHG